MVYHPPFNPVYAAESICLPQDTTYPEKSLSRACDGIRAINFEPSPPSIVLFSCHLSTNKIEVFNQTFSSVNPYGGLSCANFKTPFLKLRGGVFVLMTGLLKMDFFFVFLKSGKIAFWIILCIFSGYSIFWLLFYNLRTKKVDRAEKVENFKTLSLLLPSMYLCMLGITFPAAAATSGFGAFVILGFPFLMIFLGIFYAGLISNFIKKRKNPN
jgi:hypothetical protein